MADETKGEPVTDSRFPGFNPEVEQSKAEFEAKLAEVRAASAAAEPTAPPAPTYTHRCGACGRIYEAFVDVCASCGSAAHIYTLEAKA